MAQYLMLLLVGGFTAWLIFRSDSGIGIPVDEARAILAEGGLLLDVRAPEEFANGHIEGAMNVPLQYLNKRIGELGGLDRPIIVYCQSGTRSDGAVGILRRAGFQKVHDFGAMSRWVDKA